MSKSKRGLGFAQPLEGGSFCLVLISGSFHQHSLGLRGNHLADTETSSCTWSHWFCPARDNPVPPHSSTIRSSLRSLGLLRSEQGAPWKATPNDFPEGGWCVRQGRNSWQMRLSLDRQPCNGCFLRCLQGWLENCSVRVLRDSYPTRSGGLLKDLTLKLHFHSTWSVRKLSI